MSVFAPVVTHRLSLRPVAAADVDDLHRLWTDPGVRRYLWDDIVITRARAAETVEALVRCAEAHDFGVWALSLRERDAAPPAGADVAPAALIGFCGFRENELGGEAEAELIYGLSPSVWGRGLASEAAREALRWGFEWRGFSVVDAATDAPNVRSIAVLERLGMRCVRRGDLNGLDTVFYSCTRAEWQPHG